MGSRQVVCGVTSDGKTEVPLLVAENGGLTVSGVTLEGGSDASAANQSTQIAAANLTNTRVGDLTEAAPGTDTASSGLNGRLQRIAQRLTSLIAQVPASLGIKTAANSLSVAPASDAVFATGGLTDAQMRATAVPVSAVSLPLPTDAATSALQTAGNDILTTIDTAVDAIGAKTPALGRAAAAASVPVVDSNGQGPVIYTTNTTAVTGGSFRQVVCLTDTVFSAFTRTDATGSITGVTLPAGTVLFGPVTAYTLTSGAVAAYD
jgi:hypothetical protein